MPKNDRKSKVDRGSKALAKALKAETSKGPTDSEKGRESKRSQTGPSSVVRKGRSTDVTKPKGSRHRQGVLYPKRAHADLSELRALQDEMAAAQRATQQFIRASANMKVQRWTRGWLTQVILDNEKFWTPREALNSLIDFLDHMRRNSE